MVLDMESTGEVVRTAAGDDGGVTVVGSDVPSDFRVAPRSESSNPPLVSATPPPPSHQPGGAPPQNIPVATEGLSGGPMKKKRGRPRKYGPDGAAAALSPKPISSLAPPPASHVIDFSASEKRGRVKPAGSFSRKKYQLENLGGANFTPHVITVNAGEDVTMKIISFSQQGPRAICVLSANGVVSSVTLRQPDSSGGTLTYEGRFEILSLSGSFMPNDVGGTRSRTGGMSVSLVSPDGRVIGGGLAGLLVAASSVQVVVGSFVAEDQKPKKQKHDYMPTPTAAIPISSASESRVTFPASTLQTDTWPLSLSSNPINRPSDINVSLS
ncbi:PREDICTED: AT-hook motif nuclear-localized protein 1-like isoform X2 [Tarenaya hassleriana]|uniref:AT-hook motif nuclear-localized protein 1-like isoform X2 n=1 Tax=Tarenaya hassleriana TaxID=28532 RepID=UPI00053C436E|nr:PREDICTED: AT-hook motif nuclear-localized protein 1-like isoform X2 [Tarenaya hassleriana]